MVEIVTRPHASNFANWASTRNEVVVLSGDLTKNCEADAFRDQFPSRFFNGGLSEQNMLSVAGGLAREGYTPFVYTFGVFIYRRAMDQLQMSIAYPNLRVRLLGFLPGLSTPGGVSHQAIDDIALMSTLPNMNVISVGDATDVETVLTETEAINGPVYISMLRGQVPRLFPKNEPLVFKSARTLSHGTDLAIFSCGALTENTMRVVVALRKKGVSVSHLHISTLKPFDDPRVEQAIRSARAGVITVENHLVRGGLGTAVAELMAEKAIGKPLRRVGLRDTYGHGGSFAYLQRYYQIDGHATLREAEFLLGQHLDITEVDLDSARLEPEHGAHKPEAL
ncbi:transketolase C-terminal domain-containing protein [Mesorhizobium sp. M1403]|uniref:transketolase family protein n=1 Tax=Mesorhizobium sp. M1403 TaxID=2957097 RepID=UPI00333C6293